jgi:hypothetical protein
MEIQTNQTNLTPIVKELIEDKGDTLDYTNPKFNWDMVDESSQTINKDNPFLGM